MAWTELALAAGVCKEKEMEIYICLKLPHDT